MIEIREEVPGDEGAIRSLNLVAFENGPEAGIVDKLRVACDRYLSFIALDQDVILGQILFSPARLDNGGLVGMGLAPMAVLPSHQRRGIGSLLVRHGLKHLRQSGCPFIIVLGHPDYYPRFGFEPASRYKLFSQWAGVPDAAFMVIVFNREALPDAGGTVRYRDEFNDAMWLPIQLFKRSCTR